MSRPSMSPFILLCTLLLLILPITAHADYLGGITVNVDSPAFLPHGEQVYTTVDYKVDHPDGGIVFVRPYTMGAPTPGYGAQGGLIVPTGTGTTTRGFSIFSGYTTVTHLRVFLTSDDQSEVFLEIFVPVNIKFAPHGVFNITTSYGEHSTLPHDRDLEVFFDYSADTAGNVRVYARPFTNGVLTPGYSASGSASLPPTGSYDQHFSFDGDADITHIRFRITTEDQSEILYECFQPFKAHWREYGLYNISFSEPDGESLHNSQNLVATFTVEHNDTENRHVWAWCITDGYYSAGGVYQGSAVVAPGGETVTRYCRINTGENVADAVRLLFGTPDEILQQIDIPVDYHWAPHAVQNAVFSPAAPAILSNGEHLDMEFDYVTDEGGGVRIFMRPAYDGVPLYGISNDGSPLYGYPDGNGDRWLTFADGEHLASSIRFQMLNADQSELLFEHFYHGWWAWGQSSHIVPAADEIPAALADLGQCYPNPFNPVTNIPVSLGSDAHVKLNVYDIRGHLIRTLHDGVLTAGDHVFMFQGEGLSSGAYFCRMESPLGMRTSRMMLVK